MLSESRWTEGGRGAAPHPARAFGPSTPTRGYRPWNPGNPNHKLSTETGQLQSHASGRAVAADGGNNVLATGDFKASINFGGSTLTSPGGTDTDLVRLGP